MKQEKQLRNHTLRMTRHHLTGFINYILFYGVNEPATNKDDNFRYKYIFILVQILTTVTNQ